ncbi:MAG: hypothetical protein EAZ55_12700 [Cytophagales bacterium]|nr:MAG: hypothetical protein EAZ55_12700 [Cytophagales bacterium]
MDIFIQLTISIIILLTAAWAMYQWMTLQQNIAQKPTHHNILQTLQLVKIPAEQYANASEAIIEEQIIKTLQKKFNPIQRQFSVSDNHRLKRERIDVDLAEGAFGIEIKLAKTLKDSNERHRLLGQIQLYQKRRYHQKNLLVVIVGDEKMSQDPKIQELRNMIEANHCYFFYLFFQ